MHASHEAERRGWEGRQRALEERQLQSQRLQKLQAAAQLEAAVAADDDDHDARYQLAQALLGRGQPEAGADHLLTIMRKDREWNDDGARKAMLELFEALGSGSPLTVAFRKKLSALLFS